MDTNVRKAVAADVPAMVALAAQRRELYEQLQPVFWRQAVDADERQAEYFDQVLHASDSFALVHERAGAVDGFLVGRIVAAPPVYNPGGPTCLVDDFWVANPRRWPVVGTLLLNTAEAEARARGAVQLVAVSGGEDQPKRALLSLSGYGIASEWYVREI